MRLGCLLSSLLLAGLFMLAASNVPRLVGLGLGVSIVSVYLVWLLIAVVGFVRVHRQRGRPTNETSQDISLRTKDSAIAVSSSEGEHRRLFLRLVRAVQEAGILFMGIGLVILMSGGDAGRFSLWWSVPCFVTAFVLAIASVVIEGRED